MECITGIAITTQPGQGLGSAQTQRGLCFEYEIGGPLSKIQASAVAVKRSAGLRIKNHKGIEPIKMELREALGSAGDDDVSEAAS